MNPGALGFFVWIYGGENVGVGKGSVRGMESWYARGMWHRFGQGFVRRGESRAPEGEDIGPGKDSVGGYN